MFEHVGEGCQCEGKVCTKCKNIKCHGWYWKDKRIKSGLQAQCKDCLSKKNIAYYQSHRELIKEQVRQYYYIHAERIKKQQKEYIRINKEIVKERQHRYYRQNAERISHRMRLYRLKNLEEITRKERIRRNTNATRERRKRHRLANLEKFRTAQRLRYHRHAKREQEYSRTYYQTHKVQAKAYQQRYHQSHPGLRAVYGRNRRARIRQSVGSYTWQEWQDLKAFYNHTCLCCRKQEPEIKLTIDHIVPIVKGGRNDMSNIQPLCLSCNASKKDKIVDYRGDKNEQPF